MCQLTRDNVPYEPQGLGSLGTGARYPLRSFQIRCEGKFPWRRQNSLGWDFLALGEALVCEQYFSIVGGTFLWWVRLSCCGWCLRNYLGEKLKMGFE